MTFDRIYQLLESRRLTRRRRRASCGQTVSVAMKPKRSHGCVLVAPQNLHRLRVAASERLHKQSAGMIVRLARRLLVELGYCFRCTTNTPLLWNVEEAFR
jgi:hypothetical protein